MSRNSKGASSTIDEGEEHVLSQFRFDAKETYCPLFCLAEPPDEYFDVLARQALEHSWLNITSSATSLDGVLAEIEQNVNENPSDPAPTPFVGSTFESVEDFYDDYLRQPRDHAGPSRFCAFVFLIIDASCFQNIDSQEQIDATSARSMLDPAEWTIFLCSDAPDFGETELQRSTKFLRLPLHKVLEHVVCCESLDRTPSEASRFAWAAVEEGEEAERHLTGLVMRPPPRLWPCGDGENGEDTYRFATRFEAWSNKRRAILQVEEEERKTGKPLGFREPLAPGGGTSQWAAADSYTLKVGDETVGTLPGWTKKYRQDGLAERGEKAE